jgi:hypothetical protein
MVERPATWDLLPRREGYSRLLSARLHDPNQSLHWQDEAADETSQNCWMARRYTTNRVSRRMTFQEPGAAWRVAGIYFDATGALVGLDFSASAGPALKPNDLRFPGELRFPAEQVGPNTKSAPAKLYLRSVPGAVTNKPRADLRGASGTSRWPTGPGND